jgi:hypothetical protein
MSQGVEHLLQAVSWHHQYAPQHCKLGGWWIVCGQAEREEQQAERGTAVLCVSLAERAGQQAESGTAGFFVSKSETEKQHAENRDS